MTPKYNKAVLIAVILIIMIFFGDHLLAQCPMCKLAAESNMKAGGTAGAGLNKGILYMFALPYLLIGTIAFIWWKQQKRIKENNSG